jgi:hypothetical protein
VVSADDILNCRTVIDATIFTDFVDTYRIVTVQESLLPTTEFNHYRPRSTQLSVIEGSDDHLPANTSSPSVVSFEQHINPEEPENVTRQYTDALAGGDMNDDPSSSGAQPAIQRATLEVPQPVIRDSLTAPSSVDPYQMRTSMATSGTDFSRISGLSDFPAPPVNQNELQLTPGDLTVRETYFSVDSSASPPTSPLSAQTFEEDDPEVQGRTRDSILSGSDELDRPPMAPQSYRSTFGADDEIIRSWKASRDAEQ